MNNMKVKVKLEIRRYVEEIYWIDEEVEIPEGTEDIEEYLQYGGVKYDEDNSQITIQEEEFKIEKLEVVE
jgi:hypothetical protein